MRFSGSLWLLLITGWLTASARAQMSSLADLDREFTRVVAQVAPAVVEVEPGVSGVCVSEEGFILTDGVVALRLAASEQRTVRVTFPDQRSYSATLHASDAATRTILLKIEESVRFPAVRPGDPGELEVGHLLMTVGNAFGTARESQPAVTLGVVSSIRRDEAGRALLIETSAATNPGQNGGPYFNTDGELVGLLHDLGNGYDLATLTPINRIAAAYQDSPGSKQVFDTVSQLNTPRTKANVLSRAFEIAAQRARPHLVSIHVRRTPGEKPETTPAADAPKFEDRQSSQRLPPEGIAIPDGPITGTIVDPQGFVLTTAAPFGEDVESIDVMLRDGRSFRATLVSRDQKAGLALLLLDKQHSERLPALKVRPQEDLELGQFVIAVGALAGPPGKNDLFVTVGLLSNRHRLDAHRDALQTDAGVSFKNAGGLLVDLRGRALGILLAPVLPYGQNSGLGFAMPVAACLSQLPRMLEGQDIEPAYIGVMLADAPVGREGALVTAVTDGFPGAQAGLQPGDLILKLDGRIISRRQALSDYLARFKNAGDALRLTLKRAGETLEIELLLARRP